MLPGFWMHETSGILQPAVKAYLTGAAMTESHVAAMRAYLRQWIGVPDWAPCDELDLLRRSIDDLTTRDRIEGWLALALDIGIDPL